MSRWRKQKEPLALVVRTELRPLGRRRRAMALSKLAMLSGFIATPRWMTATILVTLGAAVALVTYPVGYRLLVNALLSRDTGGIVAGVVLTAGIFATGWALTIIGSTQSSGLTDRVNIWLSARVGHLLASIPNLEHFERPAYLAEVGLLTQNRRALAAAPRRTLNLFLNIARTVVIAVLLGSVTPVLAPLPLVGFLPLLGDDAGVRIQERTTQRMAETARLASALFGIITSASSAKELRIYGVLDELTARHRRLTDEVQRATTRAAMLAFALSCVGWVLYALVFGGAIILLAVEATRGQVSAGEIVMAITLIRRAQSQVGGVSDAFGQMVTNFRTGSRLLWLESLAARGRTPIPASRLRTPPDRLADGLVFDHVDFTYPGTDRPALRDVCLRLPAGSTVALVGENGAGKTTLVKLLMKLYEPTSGQILVDGASLAEMDIEPWRQRCTAAFQDFVRYEMRAGRIVGVGDLPRLDDDDAVLGALEMAGGEDVLASLGDGLATRVGWTYPQGRDLSGGQWQKMALARCLLRERPLITVLDEPTSSLDALAEGKLFDRLVHTTRQAASDHGVTMFVSHRFPSARIADLIVVLDDGKVVEAGDHATLLANGGAYAEMFEIQARAYR